MNEVDFALGVFISTGAGYLLGKHFERQKARAAFQNFSHQVMHSTMLVQDAIMSVVKSKLPDTDTKVLAQEMAAECAKRGVKVVLADMETGTVEKPNDNAAQ